MTQSMLTLATILLMTIISRLHAVKLTAVKVDFGGSPPNLTGPLEQNFELTEAERYKVNELKGPESFVFYRGHIYTGLSDGRIADISDCGVRTVAKLSASTCTGEADCGRPLGLRLDTRGRLIVADASKGIYRVNVDTGETELLFSSNTPVNGKKCKFINDVVVAKDGTILFTDSSTKWSRKEFLYVVLEGESTGRLLAYSDKSNKTIVVLENLAFPNGLEFGPNEEFLLVSETGRARIRKLSLKPGKTWRQLSTFAANLPGLPDNIRASGRGTYWVAMSQARHQNMSTLLDEYSSQPQMREMVAMMSSIEQIIDMTEKYGMVVELSANGEIIRTLQDPTGNQIAAVSEATEHDGFLYLGSYDQPHVSRVALTKAFHVERFLQKIKSTCRATKINIMKLRTVLRRLVAIAEFRRALLNAKKRRDEEENMLFKTKITARPFTVSTYMDLFTTTVQPFMDNTTASINATQNITESLTTQSVQNITSPTTTIAATEVVNSTTVANSTAVTNSTAGDQDTGNWTLGTTTATSQAIVNNTETIGSQVVTVTPGADLTETGGITEPKMV